MAGRISGGVKIAGADRKSIIEVASELQHRVERIRAYQDTEIETSKDTLTRAPHWLLGPIRNSSSF